MWCTHEIVVEPIVMRGCGPMTLAFYGVWCEGVGNKPFVKFIKCFVKKTTGVINSVADTVDC